LEPARVASKLHFQNGKQNNQGLTQRLECSLVHASYIFLSPDTPSEFTIRILKEVAMIDNQRFEKVHAKHGTVFGKSHNSNN
jgi:hypothetical protein